MVMFQMSLPITWVLLLIVRKKGPDAETTPITVKA
jgi:hypothetical protein